MSNKAKVILVVVVAVAVVVFAAYRLGVPGIGSGAEVQTSSGRWVSPEQLAMPIRAGIEAVQRRGTVYLSLSMTDANGKVIRSLRLPGGRRPDPPQVTIADSGGRVVYRGKLAYG